ncbi:hypothetical protein GCM10011494_17870 [Novosphingobium endophyticum]|uniref:Glycosyltransferase RgtA/B/C/D-like domain-containing protein n=1 Tax=Novosphingobium endophyticum TaxID=1955250 RepID=A0A916TS90_9SPHN|nr:hypothetical protein [Novosphingobium endophyticum]GGB99812.1 hypothetical protein GCM10011494_17870 [Novosphingobium endophyticum]
MTQGKFPAWFGAIFLLVALALRASTFGDPNLHVDETFYQTVGIAMHEQHAVPYVDVWDRKPWGLFFLYYLIAAISYAPIAYQLVATCFAAATAWVIGRIACVWNRTQGGLLAGIAYLLWLEQEQGFGAQAPIFYNLFVAVAVLLVLRALPELRAGRAGASTFVAMLLCGCAITIKQTSLFEGAFLGLYAAFTLWRSPMPRRPALATIAAWALIGALPTLAIAAWYWWEGYWSIYWHAMVTSNLAKPKIWLVAGIRLILMFIRLAPFMVLAVLSLPDMEREQRRFLSWWLFAATLGLLSVPNFYVHYALPMLLPLIVASAGILQRRIAGPVAMAVLAVLAFRETSMLDFDHARRSRAAMEELAAAVRAHDDGGPLFVYDGPYQLYHMTGHRFVTPLVFSHHLAQTIEKDVSHLSTAGEVRRVLAERPSTVVLAPKPRQDPINWETLRPVRIYIHANCRLVARVETPEWLLSSKIDVWADCNRRHQQ